MTTTQPIRASIVDGNIKVVSLGEQGPQGIKGDTGQTGGSAIGAAVGSGTSGSLLFVFPSTTLAQDASNLHYDSTNKRLGLGKATPSSQLDIQGQGANDGLIRYGNVHTNTPFTVGLPDGKVAWQMGVSHVAHPVAGGWLVQGFGGTTSGVVQPACWIQSNAGTTGALTLPATVFEAYKSDGAGNVAVLGDTDPAYAFFNGAWGVANTTLNPSLLMILGNGNVGFGTNEPAAQLHTTGTVIFEALTEAGILFPDANGQLTQNDGFVFVPNTPSTYSSDTFTDADGTLLTAHTPTSGPVWTLPVFGVSFAINGNRLAPATYSNHNIDNIMDIAQSDFVMTFDWTYGAGDIEWDIFARWQDANNQWALILDPTNSTGGGVGLAIQQVTSGSGVNRAFTSFSFVDGVTYSITVRCVGTSLSLTCDTTTVSYTSSYLQTATVVGLFARANNSNVVASALDNWLIQQVNAGGNFGIGTATPTANFDVAGKLQITNKGHITTTSSNPAITPNTAVGAGTGGTATITGTDVAGLIRVSAGTSCAPGNIATITFANAYATAPKAVMLTPADSNTAFLSGSNFVYVDNTSSYSTTGFGLFTGSGHLTDSNSYSWFYAVIG